ncbi:uncharacterized protein L201_003935 [Kwoniella dendrophila CBS 6074]|uniref:FAD-binding domain-containing protein n=1 Tax=Kwoniella dendrophila CBS 6074 TaxID=1295534 RepID=A0AAX4JUI1_9TREE
MSVATAAKKSVLISGGSIAGPAAAFWLNRYGFKTTVVERWPELRPGGQSIDVAHYGLEAVQRMGLEGELRARFTGEKGTTFTDKNNQVYMQLGVGSGPTNEFEILRGDFADMLYQETKADTEWIFGDYIIGVNERLSTDDIEVEFKSGKKEIYDYVIIAEGARSWGRKTAFGNKGIEYKPIGTYIAYFSIPLEQDTPFGDQWHVIWLSGQRAIYFRPDFKAKTQRAGIMFLSKESKGYEKLSESEQKAVIAEIYKDGGINAERMIKHLDKSEDLYFEYLGQVHAEKWSSESGKIYLCGDSAWCGTPLIGMGTSLSVAGAYILSGELAKNQNNPRLAAKSYENNFRPIVKEAQKLPPFIPRALFQESEWGVKIWLNTTTVLGWIFGSRLVIALTPTIVNIWSRFFPTEEKKTLPDYEQYITNPIKLVSTATTKKA